MLFETPYVTPSARKSQTLHFTVCTNDLFVFQMDYLILTVLKTLLIITDVGQQIQIFFYVLTNLAVFIRHFKLMVLNAAE